MPKFRVNLIAERIIEADDADEAHDRFRDDETVFYEVETELMQDEAEPAEQADPTGGAPVVDPAVFEQLHVFQQAIEKFCGANPSFLEKARKARQTP
jgi:hypothetical protein